MSLVLVMLQMTSKTMIVNYFFVPTKQGENTTNFETAIFLNKFTFCHVKLNMYIWKNKVTSHKHHLFGLFFYRSGKETLTDQSILKFFLVCLKIDYSQTFKCSGKNLFLQCACYWHNFLR